jgi:maltooligosyltrehalose synthase
VVPRLVARLGGRTWDDTTITLPGGDWISALDGEPVRGGQVSAATLLRRFPVAVLGRDN